MPNTPESNEHRRTPRTHTGKNRSVSIDLLAGQEEPIPFASDVLPSSLKEYRELRRMGKPLKKKRKK